MTRKEEIIYATLELASEFGLKAVSLGQIADKVGIKKPSLYNHFTSKDEIINEMYSLLRKQAQERGASNERSLASFEGKTLEEILTACMSEYFRFLSDQNMLIFFKVLYSERSTSASAAQIMLNETERMLNQTRMLFYALVVHGKMRNDDVDIAAVSYAMTIHSLVDMQMDRMTAQKENLSISNIPEEIKNYIKWFSRKMEAEKHE